MADAFELLGISRGSSVDEIRKAYRQMARRWHPDRFAPGPERLWAEQKMIDINAAYTQAHILLANPILGLNQRELGIVAFLGRPPQFRQCKPWPEAVRRHWKPRRWRPSRPSGAGEPCPAP